MAKVHLNRLIKKYDFTADDVTGINYRTLIQNIIESNDQNSARAAARLSDDNYKKQADRIGGKAKRLTFPGLDQVIPKRSVFTRKAAQSGKLITDTLRDKMTKALRETLKESQAAGKADMIRPGGMGAGTMNPDIAREFQKKLTQVYQSYTKRDPSIGIPPNIRNIAVTETRATMNSIKKQYADQLEQRNPGKMKFQKKWIQNRSLSKKPRETHFDVDGMIIGKNELFQVQNERTGGFDLMDRPHDPTAPPEQVIGCSCELQYFAQLIGEPVEKSIRFYPVRKSGGLYKRNIHGLDITIELSRGSMRRGEDKNGNPWEVQMVHDYGYINNTIGADGEQVDVYIGPDIHSTRVFIVHQLDSESGQYDEDKVMIGFTDAERAKDGYMAHYRAIPQVFGGMEEITLSEFKYYLKLSKLKFRRGETGV